MKTCWQLVEVAYQYEQPLTQPTTFEGAVASWRLLVSWVSSQAGWILIEKQVNAASAYATYKTPEHTLYGLWVKEAISTELTFTPTTPSQRWLVRSIPVDDTDDTEPDFLDDGDTVELDHTSVEGILDNLREGSYPSAATESAGV